MVKQSTISILLALIMLACGSQDEHTRTAFPDTKIIGHRGSGATQYSEYQENTYTAIRNAFEKLHGAETDIQSSKDGTIWLFHDAGLPTNDMDLHCIPNSTDQELMNLSQSMEGFTLTRLEEIFELMTDTSPIPRLSLDVKGHFPNGCFETDNATRPYFDKMAENLKELLMEYPLQDYIMVETDYTYFLDLVKEAEPDIELFLLGYNDFRQRMEMAMESSYHGISFNFRDEYLTGEEIELARQNGLKVQLWTLYTEEDFEKALSWGPHFIQTGNVDQGHQEILSMDSE